MKKFAILLCSISLITLISCGYSQTDVDAARKEGYDSGYKVGHDEGFDEGYDKGYDAGYDKGHEDDYDAGYDKGHEDGYDAGYDKGHEDGYDAGLTAPRPVSKPASGAILSGKEYSGSELTVIADTNTDYVVMLKDYWGTEYLSFYVRAGSTVTIGVPSKELYAFFASGEEWYGYGKGLMFGEDTDYSKDDEVLDFNNYTYTYTLYPVTGGNFTESPSNENEFF